jgi:hypothetical protein
VEFISQTVGQQLENCQSHFRQGFSGIQDKLLEQMKRDTDTPAALPVPNVYYVQGESHNSRRFPQHQLDSDWM